MVMKRQDDIQMEYPWVTWNGSGKMTLLVDNGRKESKEALKPCFYMPADTHQEIDALLEDAGMTPMKVQHQGKDRAVKYHWNLGDSLMVYPLITGVTAPRVTACMRPERNLQKSSERGLGVRWSQNQSGRPQTQLAVICYLKVLMDAGHYEPVKLAINGQMGDYVLKALVEHIRFLQNADKLRKNENPLLPYQAGLELKAGGDADFGKGDTVTTMTVLVAGHPQPRDLTLDYVNSMLMPEAHQEIIDLSVEENWERVLEFVAGFNAARDEENGNDNGNGNAPKSDAPGGGHTGRIGFEPEMRFTAKGTPFTKWSIFDEEMGGWANCIAWGSLAEKVNDASLSKGDVITVHGFWKETQYADKETGEEKTSRTLNAKKVQVGDEILIPDSENGVKIEPVPPVPSGSEDNIPF